MFGREDMKQHLEQQFQPSDRSDVEIERKLPLKIYLIDEIERSEFARDRDRILFSRAFRRLQHKAQVFSNEKGDHFRTRLTHTLEVSQISRSLARYLSANEDLAEAIAIGHDIGHTPFGHQGERVLDGVMKGEDSLGMIEYPMNYGGFKHNFNGVRVLDVVQTKFENQDGLNLTWQVLEGVLKHTRIKRCKECTNCGNCWDIKRFVKDPCLISRLYLEYKFSVTLEGQIVAIADEIAQRQHDIDDGFRDYSLKLEVNKVYDDIIAFCDKLISEQTDTINGIDSESVNSNEHINLLAQLKYKLEEHKDSKNTLYKKEVLVRDIIEYFVLDVYANSRDKIKQYPSLKDDEGRKIIDEELVSFSEFGHKLNVEIEKLVKQRILNSWEVNKFDGKAYYIIRQHFKAYYRNPLQMPDYIFKRLLKRLENTSQICEVQFKMESSEAKKLTDISFDSDRSEITVLIDVLKLRNLTKSLVIPSELQKMFSRAESERKPSKEELLKKLKFINSKDCKELNSQEDLFLKCLLESHYIYLSTICDYIAGMTDNYAKDQYKELYLVE